ncbi:xanthine dehydrogenase family protein molybdopterin-binding subunit [Ferrimicrobium sp.]|uniref:xanthine dehydrogenase family protein molybdopterin-binding subunit n=1 Tax=Ferrimicrobium sp. TaxID=2926050 RepID=UPI0026278B9C|nr:xanthine dehydrogenase family protein molybdopterin-binding subunit [Ferrimicrobium sp.]MCL5973260.1 xanthine dehydrogenase family protein molybdopterin-binding subunit [Actinomycetota bacterium]
MSILGSRVVRREDPSLLRGEGRYVANLSLDRPLFACFVISPFAHATFSQITIEDALAVPGVRHVLRASDLTAKPIPSAIRDRPDGARPILAIDRVRYVGEPVALVLADSPEAAYDGAELVYADFDPLDAVIDPEEALTDATRLFPGGSNVFSSSQVEPDPHLFDGADVVVSERLINQRLAPCSLETRAMAAVPTPDGRLVIYSSTQSAHGLKRTLTRCLDIDDDVIIVRALDVGGGFGAKVTVYPEDVAIAAAALKTGRGIKWTEDRGRSMLGLVHGRAQIQNVELGATKDGTLVGYRLHVIQDCGAYPAFGAVLPTLTCLMAQGTYAIPKVETSYVSVATNTTPISAYRGAGRPEAAAAIERMMDRLALELDMDPVELRRRNLIPKNAFPLRTQTGANYDVGDYLLALDSVCEHAGYAQLRDEQRRRRVNQAPLQLGIGVAVYVEITNGGGSSEYGRVQVQDDGSVLAYSGTSPHGQGHATAWSMLVANELGVSLDQVQVITGDTDLVPRGVGTFGSRSLQTGGVAVAQAAREVSIRAKRVAAAILEASEADIQLGIGGAFVHGSPSMTIDWSTLARRAKEIDDPLDISLDFDPEDATFPFGAHLAVVEVDTETGQTQLVALTAVDDAGKILNPLLAEGQVHGGLAQGIAQALLEEFRYGDDGTPLTPNFADYSVISAPELTSFTLIHQETPTFMNPLGAKGIGESGTIGATPAVWNAVIDAISHRGVRHINLPLTPHKIVEALN